MVQLSFCEIKTFVAAAGNIYATNLLANYIAHSARRRGWNFSNSQKRPPTYSSVPLLNFTANVGINRGFIDTYRLTRKSTVLITDRLFSSERVATRDSIDSQFSLNPMSTTSSIDSNSFSSVFVAHIPIQNRYIMIKI